MDIGQPFNRLPDECSITVKGSWLLFMVVPGYGIKVWNKIVELRPRRAKQIDLWHFGYIGGMFNRRLYHGQ